ncbi:MAG: PAS domain S-box protein [Rhodospirillaceae bacterium]
MVAAPIPLNEKERLAALRSFEVLDTPPTAAFDRYTGLAAKILGVPISVISLIDEVRQWFKSHQGLDVDETPREWAFCAHAILGSEPLVITDATADPRFCDNPLVTAGPGIRFYAGAPLRTRDNYNIGTLCIIDNKFHKELSATELDILRDIADAVVNELYLHKTAIDLHRSKRMLSDRQERLAAILVTAVDGIITIDHKGIVETFNPAAGQIFGYSKDEVIGKNIKMLMPEPYFSEHDGYLENYNRTGVAHVIGIGREVTGRKKDGSLFPMELSVGQMELSGSRMFTGIVRDITERKQVEKLKAEFISTVSHELRTPLTAIRGSLSLVNSGVMGDINGDVRELTTIAEQSCERLVRLINDILDVETIGSGQLQLVTKRISIIDAVARSLADIRPYAEQLGVSLCRNILLPAADIEADFDRVVQILTNLLANACKFSPPGDEVRITVAEPEPGWVRVSVSDHGRGIPEEFRSRIFGKFAQADSSDSKSKGGTGLGLNITKGLVERMNGHIRFESEPGQATIFHVEFTLLTPNDRK